MPFTTTCELGDVVVVDVAFSDQSGSKLRPALVVSAEAFHRSLPDLIVCPISSQPRHYRQPALGDRPLKDWRSVGLRYPSTVRVSKVLAVDKRIIERVLGRASRQDLARVRTGLRGALGLR